MADLRLRINELPEELNPAPIDNIAIDGPSTRRTTLQRAADAVRPYSTEAMAREGLNNATAMTPLRVSQAIETLGGQRFASAQQGNKADTAVQPTLTISAGVGLAGGGTLAANREIALNSASIASLALANSAVQPARAITAGTGLSGGGDLSADRSLSLSAATQASLAKADSAIQAPGGTAGQILAKASSNPNDVDWVNIEGATAVSYGPQTLTQAQQGQARANIGAGILAGFRNQLINGDFPINQRGNRNLAPGENMIVLDRWYVTNNTNQTVGVSQQAFAPGQTDVPGEPAFYLNLNFPIAPTTGTLGVTQRIESVRTLANEKATVTAYTSGPASNGGTLTCSLGQNFGVGGSPSTSVITPVPLNIGAVFDPSTRKRQGIIDMPSIAGKTIGTTSDGYVALAFTLTPRATGNYSLARVSVVKGDATAEADPSSPRHIQQEFALCQRYYTVVRQTYSGNVTTGFTSFNRMRISPPMRAAPTVSATVVTQSGFSSTIANASASAETCIVGVNGTNTQGAGEFTIDSRLDAEL